MMKKIRNLFLVAAMIAAAVSFPVFGESFEAAETGVPAEAAVFAEGAVSAPEEAAVFAEAAESVPEELTEAAGAIPAEATGADASLPAEVTDAKLAGGTGGDIKWFLTADQAHAGFNRLSIAVFGAVPETVIDSGSFDIDALFTAETVPWKDYKEKISSVRIGSEDDIVTVRNAAYWFSGCTALTDVCVDYLVVRPAFNGDKNSMVRMFSGCTALETLDLSKWAADAARFAGMFEGCSNLKTIYADSQNEDFRPGSHLQANADVFEGCTSLVAEAGDFYEKTTYEDLVDPITDKKDVTETFAVVNGYYGKRGIFTESNPDVAYDGLHVRFNHKWLEFPASMRTVTYDMKAFGADGGTVIINRNPKGLIDEVIIDSVKLSSYERDYGEEIPGMLLIDAKVLGDYRVIFRGENDIMYLEEPDRSLDDDSMMVLVPVGSRAEISGEDGASLKVSGLNAQEYKNGRLEPTTFRFADLTIQSRSFDSYAMMVYATKIRFDRCLIDAKTMEDPLCFILGSGNNDLAEEEYRVEFYDTSLKAENLLTDIRQSGFGAPSPSAFNVSHSAVELHNCDFDLHLPHIPIGECRGVYMLHGGITIDGGSLKAVMGDDPVDTASLEVSCGIQAVYVNILNGARVDLDVSLDLEKFHDPEHTISSWGIIYAQNTVVEDSELTISAKGSNGQGIYYYGKSSAPDSVADTKAYHPYGDVIIRNSDVSIKTAGNAENYVSTGISCRHLYFDYPVGSNKKTDIEVSEENDRCLTVGVYDFHEDGNLTYQNGAKLLFPEKTVAVKTEYPAFYEGPFYTYVPSDPAETDLKKIAPHHVTIGAASSPYVPTGGGSSVSALYTGTWEKPVTGGTWTHNEDGTWSFATTRRFVSTWACIANSYAGGKADWFYFDGNGKMVTGWQWLPWKGVTRCYFFNPISDGRQGACQLGGVTYDGFTVDETGAWTVNGVVQVKN
ncbi:MAG: hypothetical protein MJ063_08390 [Lachnospiraceae bacterium]|nr:hypothetical protein [Lachnospiraceae bacterium]